MLAIRLQRTGRRGHANFRVVVQDSRQSPMSGKFVALLGSYDPHAKSAQIVKDKAEFYLKHGAQPSNRVAKLLKSEGVKIPGWVALSPSKKKAIRNPEKLKKNRPAQAEKPSEPATNAAAPPTEAPTAEESQPVVAETPETEPNSDTKQPQADDNADKSAVEPSAESSADESSTQSASESSTESSDLETTDDKPAESANSPAESE